MINYIKRFHPYESTAHYYSMCYSFSIFQGDPTQGLRDSTDRSRLTNDPSDHKKFDLTHTSHQAQVTKSKRGYERKETTFPYESRRLKSRMAEEDSMVEASSLVQSLSYMKSPFFNLTNLMRSEKAGTKVDPNLTNISTISKEVKMEGDPSSLSLIKTGPGNSTTNLHGSTSGPKKSSNKKERRSSRNRASKIGSLSNHRVGRKRKSQSYLSFL